MDRENIKQIKAIDEEIQELKHFLRIAREVWTGTLTLKKILSNAFGVYNKQEYWLNTKMKNKMLVILEEQLKELYQKLDEM